MEIPYTGRAIINDWYDGAEITIPAKKNWFIIVFFCVWLCGWVLGETFAVREILPSTHSQGPQLFVAVWLCGWTFGGIFAFSVLWWNLAGKEIITVSKGVLTIAKKGAIAKAKSYDLSEAKNFRAVEEPDTNFGFGTRSSASPFNIAGSGTIKFDYGMQTVKFGDKLYQAEAEHILERLHSKKLI